MGSLCAASPIASLAVASSTPAISNMMRPGFTTETHFSGAPLPLPMRVSAGFLVNGLSGKMRIQSLPPRLMKRVMATREASICRSVIHAASMAFRPYSPKAKSPPRHALPVRLPRICFRYFTFLGINIAVFSFPVVSFVSASGLRRRYPFALLLQLGSALRNVFPLVDPALHANHPVSRVGLRETEIDIRAQGLQRQAALQVPFLAGDFRAVQAAGHAHLDALATEAQRGVHRFAHRAAESHALFELQRNRFGDQLRVQLRTVHFLNVDVHFALGALLHFLLQLVDLRALAPDDDARPRGVNAHDQLVGRTLDVDRADARALQLFLQFLAELDVFVKKIGVVLVGIPPRLPRFVVAQPESVRVRLLSHDSPYFLPFFEGACFPVKALRTRRAVPRTPFCASASATLAATRSAAAT